MQQDGLYVIAGETFDHDEVVSGFRLFKKLKKKLRKLKNVAQQGLKFATPALGVASLAMPALAPAAAATALASRVTRSAKRGHRPARAAMRMLATSADRGDADAQRFLSISQRIQQPAPRTLLNPAMMRELAKRARKGNIQASRMLRYVSGLADAGDPAAQALIEQAAGTTSWDLTAGHALNSDLEIMGCVPALPPLHALPAPDLSAGGAMLDFYKPRRGYRASTDTWGPRDAYRLGIEAAPRR
jgi:hypothetical protein